MSSCNESPITEVSIAYPTDAQGANPTEAARCHEGPRKRPESDCTHSKQPHPSCLTARARTQVSNTSFQQPTTNTRRPKRHGHLKNDGVTLDIHGHARLHVVVLKIPNVCFLSVVAGPGRSLPFQSSDLARNRSGICSEMSSSSSAAKEKVICLALGASIGLALPGLLSWGLKAYRRRRSKPLKLGYWQIRGLAQPIRSAVLPCVM